jgi:hypothetical protein
MIQVTAPSIQGHYTGMNLTQYVWRQEKHIFPEHQNTYVTIHGVITHQEYHISCRSSWLKYNTQKQPYGWTMSEGQLEGETSSHTTE